MAMAFVWICAVGAFVVSLYFANAFGLVLLLAAVWYWLAVRWMDANDAWGG